MSIDPTDPAAVSVDAAAQPEAVAPAPAEPPQGAIASVIERVRAAISPKLDAAASAGQTFYPPPPTSTESVTSPETQAAVLPAAEIAPGGFVPLAEAVAETHPAPAVLPGPPEPVIVASVLPEPPAPAPTIESAPVIVHHEATAAAAAVPSPEPPVAVEPVAPVSESVPAPLPKPTPPPVAQKLAPLHSHAVANYGAILALIAAVTQGAGWIAERTHPHSAGADGLSNLGAWLTGPIAVGILGALLGKSPLDRGQTPTVTPPDTTK